jgi:hypothetical protein
MESIQIVFTITRIIFFDMHKMDVMISFYNGDFYCKKSYKNHKVVQSMIILTRMMWQITIG